MPLIHKGTYLPTCWVFHFSSSSLGPQANRLHGPLGRNSQVREQHVQNRSDTAAQEQALFDIWARLHVLELLFWLTDCCCVQPGSVLTVWTAMDTFLLAAGEIGCNVGWVIFSMWCKSSQNGPLIIVITSAEATWSCFSMIQHVSSHRWLMILMFVPFSSTSLA